jgi:UbiD family decarboxylase
MRHYMQTLRERGEILDVHREVDPKHELAAVTQAAMRAGTSRSCFTASPAPRCQC